ncbi:hypothetical protein ACQPV1_18490 [Clostridium neonatale]|uniref:hypothetical protein n=1 Tax=Clostridium neonatale TaxID=137838 RepID=UPI003D337DC9
MSGCGNCGFLEKIPIIGGLFKSNSGGCGYHPGPSETEAHAKKIADELAEMKENIRESSEQIEKKLINYINESMYSFIKELENINNESYGGKSLNINIKGIQQKNEDLKKEVIGHIGDVMEERLVLTDKELSVILEERDDKKRAKNFDDFCKKIQKKALKSLESKIEITVRKQEAMIRKEIETRLEEVEKNMKETADAYTQILQIKEKDSVEMEKKQIKYIYKYELFDILLDQLEN